MAMGIFVIANDVTAMSVALPSIEKSFDTDVSTVQWVVNAYALVFGVLIVSGGRLADMFGRRRILFLGAAVFAVFSLVGGLAPNVGVLIAARALMGIGGAMMWPAILGLVYAILPSEKAGLAGGLVIGTAGIGNAAGPLLGGFVAGSVGWRWILLLNVPIAAVACLVTRLSVPADAAQERSRIDYAGVATISIGLVSLLVALDAGPDDGWTSATVVAGFAVAVVLVASFVVIERRTGDDALVPPSVMGNLGFASACVATLLMSSTFFAALLYLPQFFQKVLGDSSLVAGAGLLPMMAVFTATSFAAGALYNHLGAKVVVSAGALMMAVGPFLLTFVSTDSGYAVFVPGMVVIGIGVGLFYSSVTTAGVTALDESRSSLAGGILYMFQLAGGSVGLALTTTVFLAAANSSLDHDAAALGVAFSASDREAVRGVLAGTDSAGTVLVHHPGEVGEQLVHVVRDAFSAGIRWAFRLDAALALAGFIVAVTLVGGAVRRRTRTADGAVDPTR
jgi:EmrB/QacA subfamily drug resistance transporter